MKNLIITTSLFLSIIGIGFFVITSDAQAYAFGSAPSYTGFGGLYNNGSAFGTARGYPGAYTNSSYYGYGNGDYAYGYKGYGYGNHNGPYTYTAFGNNTGYNNYYYGPNCLVNPGGCIISRFLGF